VLIHPASLRDARVRSALSRCLNGLRYGTVGVNVWAGVGFAMTLTPWGAFPGGDHRNVGSGIGMVHNPLRLPDPHKSVLHAPFRTVPPPASLPLFGRPVEINRALLEVTRAPSPRSVTALGSAAVRGWLPDRRSADRG
jgi:aldehyde dehydrogenase (NAD(P)+)